MQNYKLSLSSEISSSFRSQKACHSVDLPTEEKSKHEISVDADFESEFTVGVVYGASGTGKTTLMRSVFGEEKIKSDCFDVNKSVLDLLPESFSYEDCQKWLNGIGLTSVPCWVRPLKTLSNGQLARASALLSLSKKRKITIIDEWTSVVDRTSAKIMSHSVQRFARKNNLSVILITCHKDVIEWLDPDWVLDLNVCKFIDRRLLPQSERKRKEKLSFSIRECSSKEWKRFSKYHYLSSRPPTGPHMSFGLFHENDQIAFMNLSKIVPQKKNRLALFHSSRVVLLPEYVGLGIGIRFVNEVCKYAKNKYRCRIMTKLSSIPLVRSRLRDKKNWSFRGTQTDLGNFHIKKSGFFKKQNRVRNFRKNVKTYLFEFVNQSSSVTKSN